jgi:effector-binding domain-containing protein
LSHEVTVAHQPARPTLVVAAATTWREFPGIWVGMLDEVWALVAAQGLDRGCRNVMLYLDDVPHVEVGVERREPCRPEGRVIASALPAGRTAMTVHRGPYERLGAAHDAVAEWCAANGLQPAGPRWEIYGHHRADPAELETEVHHLLR